MADSMRQLILNAVDARLKTILTTATPPYETNLGEHVFEWLPRVLEDSECPAVIWKDLDEVPSNLTIGKYGYHQHALRVELAIVDASAGSTPANLRKALADVTKAVGADTTWGGLAIRTDPVPNDMAVEQADRIAGAFRLTIQIDYQTQKWNPYG